VSCLVIRWPDNTSIAAMLLSTEAAVHACHGRAVRKIVAEYCERAGARVVTVNIPFPVSAY
jgi:hypothetical protein